QRVALFTQDDATVQRYHRHAIHFAVCHLQCHVCILLVSLRLASFKLDCFRLVFVRLFFFSSGFGETIPAPPRFSNIPPRTCNSRTRDKSACSVATQAAASRPDSTAKHLRPRELRSDRSPPQHSDLRPSTDRAAHQLPAKKQPPRPSPAQPDGPPG